MVVVWASGNCTTAVVSVLPKVKVRVVLRAAMRLGTSVNAKRVAVEIILGMDELMQRLNYFFSVVERAVRRMEGKVLK